MKKRYSILVSMSLLVALLGIAAAPMGGGTATLVGVEYVPNKGPVFTFQVSGDFSSFDKGIMDVPGQGSYPLYCTQVDEETVKCTGPKKVEEVFVFVSWGGFNFSAFVPEAPTGPTQYCYGVYDFVGEGQSEVWSDHGPYCQDLAANSGDTINFYNPDWDVYFDYWFVDQGDVCNDIPYNGPAYYYTGCFGGF